MTVFLKKILKITVVGVLTLLGAVLVFFMVTMPSAHREKAIIKDDISFLKDHYIKNIKIFNKFEILLKDKRLTPKYSFWIEISNIEDDIFDKNELQRLQEYMGAIKSSRLSAFGRYNNHAFIAIDSDQFDNAFDFFSITVGGYIFIPDGKIESVEETKTGEQFVEFLKIDENWFLYYTRYGV